MTCSVAVGQLRVATGSNDARDASLFDSRLAAVRRQALSSTRGQTSTHVSDGTAAGRGSGGAPDRLAVAFAADADAPQQARAAASRALAHWTPERRDVALLVISELVTNAVRHGARDDSDEVALLVRRRGGATRIEVTDPRSATATDSSPTAASTATTPSAPAGVCRSSPS